MSSKIERPDFGDGLRTPFSDEPSSTAVVPSSNKSVGLSGDWGDGAHGRYDLSDMVTPRQTFAAGDWAEEQWAKRGGVAHHHQVGVQAVETMCRNLSVEDFAELDDIVDGLPTKNIENRGLQGTRGNWKASEKH